MDGSAFYAAGQIIFFGGALLLVFAAIHFMGERAATREAGVKGGSHLTLASLSASAAIASALIGLTQCTPSGGTQ